MSVRVKINPDAERQIAAMTQKAFKRFEGDLNRRRSHLTRDTLVGSGF